MRIKKGILMVGMLVSLSVSCASMASTYTKQGFIAKAFKVDNVSTVTGSVLYQKGILKDTIVYEGITTKGLTAEFKEYVGNSNGKKMVYEKTLPEYGGKYKYKEERKVSAKYTYGLLKIISSRGTDNLKATQ